jgi:hypothetical protein
VDDILFGAATSLYIDARFATYVLGPWEAGQSSLFNGQPADRVLTGVG